MFRILHLSDLHCREKTRWSTTSLLHAAKTTILEEANRLNIDVVTFTGDVAFSGISEDYKLARNWLEDVCISSDGLNLDQGKILFIPGNHDVYRESRGEPAKALEEKLKCAKSQADIMEIYQDSHAREIMLNRFCKFRSFCLDLTGSDDFATGNWHRTFDTPNGLVRFEGFNSAWVSRDDHDKGRLLIGQEQFNVCLEGRDEADFVIAMVHHPLSSLMDFDEQNCQNHFLQSHDLVLSGHIHNQDSLTYKRHDDGYLQLSGGALHDEYESQNQFSIIDLDDSLRSLDIRTFVWHNSSWKLDRNCYSTDNGIGHFVIPEAQLAKRNRSKGDQLRSKELDSLRSNLGKSFDRRIFHEFVVSEDVDPALRYFFLQGTAFMGRVVYGDAHRTWLLTPEGWNIVKSDRLEQVAEILQGVKITNVDFTTVFQEAGHDIWIYADPPYVGDTLAPLGSQLYQHSFSLDDHKRLADTIRRCSHQVLLSYDDDPDGVIRSLYSGFYIVEKQWAYSGSTKSTKKIGRELLIVNYDLQDSSIIGRLERTKQSAA